MWGPHIHHTTPHHTTIMATTTIIIVQPIGSSFALVGLSSSSLQGGAQLDGSFGLSRAVIVSDVDPHGRDLQALADHGPSAVGAEDVGLPMSGVRVTGPILSATVTAPASASCWRYLLAD